MRFDLIRRSALSVVLVLTLTVSALAQGQPNATPESIGMSGERLHRLSTAMKQAVDEGQVAGLVTLVMRKGKVAHFQSFGELDREKHVPMPKDAIFRIASMSKAITSVAAVMLMEEGKIVIDDPVSKFIPAYKKTTVMVPAATVTGDMTSVPARREITIRDLLTHTAGLSYGTGAARGAVQGEQRLHVVFRRQERADRRDDGAAGVVAAGVAAGRALGIWLCHRSSGCSRRESVWFDARRVLPDQDFRAAEDG